MNLQNSCVPFPRSVCPSCGYCPHCGRGGYGTVPYWPTYQPYYGGPYYNGAWGGQFTYTTPINTAVGQYTTTVTGGSHGNGGQ